MRLTSLCVFLICFFVVVIGRPAGDETNDQENSTEGTTTLAPQANVDNLQDDEKSVTDPKDPSKDNSTLQDTDKINIATEVPQALKPADNKNVTVEKNNPQTSENVPEESGIKKINKTENPAEGQDSKADVEDSQADVQDTETHAASKNPNKIEETGGQDSPTTDQDNKKPNQDDETGDQGDETDNQGDETTDQDIEMNDQDGKKLNTQDSEEEDDEETGTDNQGEEEDKNAGPSDISLDEDEYDTINKPDASNPKKGIEKNKHYNKIEENAESSHFFAYLVCAVIVVAILYIANHNRRKIIAFVVEGRRARGYRRPKTSGYQKLDQHWESPVTVCWMNRMNNCDLENLEMIHHQANITTPIIINSYCL